MEKATIAMHIKATRHRIEYWREAAKEAAPGSEIEKLCRRMIEQHEKRLDPADRKGGRDGWDWRGRLSGCANTGA